MSQEKRVRWNPAQRQTIERRGGQVVGAVKALGTLLFGTDEQVKKLGEEALDDVREQTAKSKARRDDDAAIVVAPDEED